MGCHGLGARESWILSSTPLLMGFAILESFLNLPGSQFPHLQIENGRLRPECLVPVPYPVCSQAQGVVKDLEPELLRHLAQGTASLLITTKGSPQGELRGQVGQQCGPGGQGVGMGGWSRIGLSPLCPVSHFLSLNPRGGRIILPGW